MPPKGKGYAAMQRHHNDLIFCIYNKLVSLATIQKLMNPIHGMVPYSP
jgi:hypothetical protein